MKRINDLMLAARLVLVPTVGLADFDVVSDDTSDFTAVVPEPTAAVLMAVGLGIVGLALRRRR